MPWNKNISLIDFKKFNFLNTDHFCLLGHSLWMSNLLTLIGSKQGRAIYFFNYGTNSKFLFRGWKMFWSWWCHSYKGQIYRFNAIILSLIYWKYCDLISCFGVEVTSEPTPEHSEVGSSIPQCAGVVGLTWSFMVPALGSGHGVNQFVQTRLLVEHNIPSFINVSCVMTVRQRLHQSVTLLSSIGRKKTMLLCIFLQGASGVACGFAPEYYSFIILRLLVGSASMGLFMTVFVLGECKTNYPFGFQYLSYPGNITWKVYFKKKTRFVAFPAQLQEFD